MYLRLLAVSVPLPLAPGRDLPLRRRRSPVLSDESVIVALLLLAILRPLVQDVAHEHVGDLVDVRRGLRSRGRFLGHQMQKWYFLKCQNSFPTVPHLFSLKRQFLLCSCVIDLLVYWL